MGPPLLRAGQRRQLPAQLRRRLRLQGELLQRPRPGDGDTRPPIRGGGLRPGRALHRLRVRADVVRGLRRPGQLHSRLPRLRAREALLQQEDRGLPGVRLRLLDGQLAVRGLLLPERRHGHVRPSRGLLHHQGHPRHSRQPLPLHTRRGHLSSRRPHHGLRRARY